MAPSQPSILIALLRNDLRIVDHSIFHLAHYGNVSSRITHVLPVYVFDERQIELGAIEGYQKASKKEARTRVAGFWKANVHRTKFLHESLVDLDDSLQKLGSALSVYFGQPERVIPALVKAFTDKGLRVEGVWLGRENTSEEIQTQDKLDAALQETDTALHLVESGRTLIHPDDLPFDPSGKNMPEVYTAFRQKVEGLGENMVRSSLRAPERFKPLPDNVEIASAPGAYQLPAGKNFKDVLPQLLAPLQKEEQEASPERSYVPYKGGLTAGGKRLRDYTTGRGAPIATYKETRNGLLGSEYSTKFSPWLANGTLSPKVIYEAVESWEAEFGANKSSYWIKFELLWRDFFSFLMERHGNSFFHLSGLGLPQQEAPRGEGRPGAGSGRNKHGQQTLDGYWLANDWEKGSESDVKKWCYGTTGVPFIDANMRELKESGFMSNRGRQNIASYFTKDMGHQDWRIGAEWFESYLLDYDVTSNWGNWQYQAGVGVDPRSARQFNIIKQGKDYDADGAYVAHWLPKLASVFEQHQVPLAQIHHPWTITSISNALRADPETAMYASQPKFEQKSWISHYKRTDHGKSDHTGSKQHPNSRNGARHGAKKGNPGPKGGKVRDEQIKHRGGENGQGNKGRDQEEGQRRGGKDSNADRPTENGPA